MEYLSLYDYLGKPAGAKLGLEVAAAASQASIKLENRDVETPNYTGKILLYPKDFLDFYFREPDTIKESDPIPGADEWIMSISDRQDYDDDLPF